MELTNKVLLYKVVLKLFWTYGIPLSKTASYSNLEIIQQYQLKTLLVIANATWYVSNRCLHNSLEEISKVSSRYLDRLSGQISPLAISLLDESDESLWIFRTDSK